jgi:hypothetical protein
MDNCSDGTLSLACFSHIFAKLAGILIITMSFTLKVPQIFTIVYNKSAKGISTASIYSDLINVLCSLLYCYKYNLPLSISGEYISLTAQNFLILLLSWYYGKDDRKPTMTDKVRRIFVVICFVVFTYVSMFCDIYPPYVWDLMAATNVPTVGISRFSQISQLYKTGEVGSLSLASFILRTFKNFIKTILLMIETNDYILIFNQIYNGLLGTIVISMIIYYGGKEKDQKDRKDKKD